MIYRILKERKAMENYYYSIASGSKGNSGLLITPSVNILIDMGISYKYLCESLEKYNINKIDAILITHEHQDHIKGLTTLTKKTNIPVYITKKSYEKINDLVEGKNINFFNPSEAFYVKDAEIISFRTPHDSDESVGFFIKTKEINFGFATDLGFMPKSVLKIIEKSNFLVLESNYDENMLKNGIYPRYLKERVASNEGHLSNDECARTVCYLKEKGVKEIMLAHISENNNSHKCIKETMEKTLEFYNIAGKIGEDIHIAPIKNEYPLIKIKA